MALVAGPLWVAAEAGDVAAVKRLLETLNPADVNAQDADGRTALHKAASRGHVAVTWQLLQHGADPGLLDIHGRSVMWAAVDGNSGVIVRMLAAHGVDPFAERCEGILTYAAEQDKATAAGAIERLTDIDEDELLQYGDEIVCEEDGTLYRVVCVLGDGGHLGMVYGVRRMRPGQGDFDEGRLKALQVIRAEGGYDGGAQRSDHIHKADVSLALAQGPSDKLIRVLHSFICASPAGVDLSCSVTHAWENDLEHHTGFGLGHLPLHELSSWAYQIARALQQVHARDVVHNNLSLENILVRGGGEELGLAGFGLSLRRSFVRVITASGYLRAKRTLATAPEIRRAIDDVKGNPQLADRLQVVLTERLADSKQDMWSYGILLLRLMGLQNEHYPGKDDKSDTYCELLSSPDTMRQRFIDVATQRFQPSNGHEELVLASIVDAALGCVTPTPGPRLSASAIISTLIPMDPTMAELGKFTRDADLVPLGADGAETGFAVPFGAGCFGAVYRVKVRRDNTRWVMKRIKRADDAELMLDEIRLVSRLASDNIVRYFAAVYEGGNNGGACRGFLMEQMDEDLLTHLTDRPELQPIPGGNATVAQLHRVAEILCDVARGLAAMHALVPPVVHRDLHIRNVLMKGGRAKVTDFGCARIQGPAAMQQTDYPGFCAVAPPEATGMQAGITPLHPNYDTYGLGLLGAQVVNRLHDVADWEELVRGHTHVVVNRARAALARPAFPVPPAGVVWASLITRSQAIQPQARITSGDAVVLLTDVLQHLQPHLP